jgi:hypothetical protein
MKNMNNERYLFSWDEIPGIDSCRLIEFLKQDLGIDWVKEEQLKKDEKSRTLTSWDGKKTISLILNDNKTKVNLIINQCLTLVIKTIPLKKINFPNI